MMNWKRFWIKWILISLAFGSLGFLQNINVEPIGSERMNTTEAAYQEALGNETGRMENR